MDYECEECGESFNSEDDEAAFALIEDGHVICGWCNSEEQGD